MKLAHLLWAAACLGASCAHAPRATGPAIELASEPPILGRYVAAVDADGRKALLGEGLYLERGGDAQSSGDARFLDGAELAAPDGVGHWLVAVDRQGRLLRVRDRGVLEEVGVRFGLASLRFAGVCAVDAGRSAFFTRDEVVLITDGTARRYAVGAFHERACGGGQLAIVARDGIHRLDAVTLGWHLYPLHASAITLDDHGELWAARGATLYRTQAEALVIELEAEARITALGASGERVFFAAGPRLAWLDGHRYASALGVVLGTGARLARADGGKLWLLERDQARRVGAPVAAAANDARFGNASWATLVRPVVDRSCGSCHRPGGRGGFDLTEEVAWIARRRAIHQRVVEDRNMPPESASLTDEDRQSLRRWLEVQH